MTPAMWSHRYLTKPLDPAEKVHWTYDKAFRELLSSNQRMHREMMSEVRGI